MTLREALRSRANALNGVRVVLAVLVLVSHAWPHGGFGPDPRVGDLTLGSWAVAGFFVISGYLVTGSRMRTGLRAFTRHRLTRIYPGFWACLVVLAFAFCPLAAAIAGVAYDPAAATRFVWANSTTIMYHQRIGAELDGIPQAAMWDGPLWTLRYELACYLVVGLVLSSGWARRRAGLVTGTAVALVTAIALWSSYGPGTPDAPASDALRLAGYFAAGSLLWAVGDRVRVSRSGVLVAAGLLGGCTALGVVHLVGALPLAYLLLVAGARGPALRGDRDLSYGVYVYAGPVQQLLALSGVLRYGVVAYIASTAAVVLPVAWCSWVAVERPALEWGRKRRSSGAFGPAPARSRG